MTLVPRIVFYFSCAVAESALIVMAVALGGDGRIWWGIASGAAALLVAHLEARTSYWIGPP